LVFVHELKGKEVYGKRGIKVGKIEDVEVDNNWQVKALDVKMSNDIAKVLGEKAGFMKEKVVALPANMLGPIGDTVTLNQEINNFDELRQNIRTERAF
jgi:sporulation protein YlmC with PRC-barrel domain